jgi:hypothetical protein
MIITPADDSVIKLGRNSEKEYYDEFGNRYKNILNRISINPDNKVARYEKIALMKEDTFPNTCIYKECAVGPILKTPERNKREAVYFNNYTYSVVDRATGAYIQSGGFCPYPDDENPAAYMCYGENNQLSPESMEIDNENCSKRVNRSLEDSKFSLNTIDSEVCLFENQYQLPYMDTVGFLDTFFSTWTFTYPLDSYILIDSLRKEFNVPIIKYMPGISREAIRNIYITLITEVGAACEYLFRVLEGEKRRLAIKVFLHPFGSVIRIHDYDRKIMDRFNNYNSTQIQSVMKSIRAGGVLGYISSEGLDILESCHIYKPVEQALENSGNILFN